MITWSTLRDLHVLQKLEDIIGKWFQIDLIFIDEFGRLKNDFDPSKFDFKSYLFKVYRNSPRGKDYLITDVEEGISAIKKSGKKAVVFNTFLPHIKAVITELVVEETKIGYLMGYC